MNNVRQLRKKIGLSQAELANKLSVHQTLISQIERGVIVPSGATLVELADFFGVSTDYVLGRRLPSASSVAGHILAIANYKHISLDEIANKLGITIAELDRKLFEQKDSELAADTEFLQEIASALFIDDFSALVEDDTYSADTYENYIAFLTTKQNKGYPLTPDESAVLCDYINADPLIKSIDRFKGILHLPSFKRVPLIGTIACGDPILAVENQNEEVDMPEHIRADFALLCKGDSMINARIHDGDIAYIREQPAVENGQIAAVVIEDEVTLKRVYLSDDQIMLVAENPKYQPLVYHGETMNSVRILGLAVAFTSILE